MNSIVVYHSTAGSTKKIAEAIYKGMNKASVDGDRVEILPIKKATSAVLADYDLVGIGGPVMHMRELHNITRFVEYTLETMEGKHGFAFCTHGALPAHFLWRVVPLMTQRGLTVIGWNDWFGSVFHPATPKPYFTDGHPDDIDLKEAEDFGAEMVERSRRIYAGETQLIPPFPRGREYEAIYEPLRVKEREEGRDMMGPRSGPSKMATAQSVGFTVNTDKCNYPKCHLCIDNCTMDAIDFSESPPVFNVDCDRCWLCEMTCPTGAIEFDYGPFQAVHEVRPGDSGLQRSLEIFEEQGRFRRLVPLGEVGWDKTFGNFKKPRYKIV